MKKAEEEVCNIDSGQGRVVGCCEHGNVSSVSIKDVEFIDKLSDYQLHEKYSALWS
jgi:hypothetical protein